MAAVDLDPKTALNQFCQKYCARPVRQTDITYTTTEYGRNQFQAIVKLNCLEGQEYAGEVCANQRVAERSAAQQALQAFAPVLATLKTKPAPKRSTGGAASASRAKAPANGVAPSAAAAAPIDGAAPAVAAADGNPSFTQKVKLNAFCMAIAKRALQKGETVYECKHLGTEQAPGVGWQASVQCRCLPGEWAEKVFVGEVSDGKAAAEQAAAAVAVAAIEADPQFAEAVSAATADSQNWSRGKGGGKGRSKGAGKGAGKTAGKGGGKGRKPNPRPSGPDLPRERLTEAPVEGEVLSWMGSFGWIKAKEPVEHPTASRRGGKIYVHRQDLPEGAGRLDAGNTVRFHVYADASGLGAEEVSVMNAEG